MKHEMVFWTHTGPIMWPLFGTGEPDGKALDLQVTFLTLICGHELWIGTKRIRWWIQAAKMSFLCQAGLSLKDRVESLDFSE